MNCLVRPILSPAVPVRVQRALVRQAYRSSMPPRGCRFSPGTLGGVPVVRTRCGQTQDGVVLYLHGGGFIIGSADTHRGLTGHLARASQCLVVTPDYRLAPEHPFPAALDDVEAAYLQLLAEGYEPGQIALAGDSAGGGLCVSLAMRLREHQHPLPSSLTLLSPWTDLTQEHLYQPESEPVLQPAWTAKAAKLYAGDSSLTDPLISPVFGNLRGLPPILIQVGSDEILLNDAERMAQAATRDRVPVSLEIYNSLWHVFQVHSGQLRRATEAVQAAGDYIRANLKG